MTKLVFTCRRFSISTKCFLRYCLLLTNLWTVQTFAQPNIVIILADDLGWNDVSYHGSEIRTPNLDALAAEGVVLNQFHAQPICTPTRTALMTGKSPQRFGIYQPFTKHTDVGLPAEEVTLADRLQAAGYQTWLVGKWHLGFRQQKFHPNGRGFEHFYGNLTGGIGYWDHVHGGGHDWQRNGNVVREDGYTTHLLADEARTLIRQRKTDQPFFLYLSFNTPHLPNEAPEETIASYSSIDDRFRRIHAAMVTEMDTAIGQVIETLKSEDQIENTLIWFMSDNGGLNLKSQSRSGLVSLAQNLEEWFEPPVPVKILELIRTNTLEGGSDNGSLRFGKGSVYEGGTRVPSLAYWPGVIPAHHAKGVVTVQDVLPTLLAAIGDPIPTDLDGGDRLGILTNHPAKPPRDYVTRDLLGMQAYYQWPWKLIKDEEIAELYNLDEDPYEQNDLSTQEPQRVAQMTRLLDRLPRKPSIHAPFYRSLFDPDLFGGAEDRQPWAELTEWEE
ncbi:MAG: sulfatase-like hydrolase/transferase [Pseudomonadota bacterium]